MSPDRTLNTVLSHLKLQPIQAQARPSPAAHPLEGHKMPTAPVHTSAHRTGVDIRALKDEKKPNSARQMACLVAFYLQEQAPEGESKATVTTADLEKYFKQASFKLPDRMEAVLSDAKRAGYFETAARGAYKLTRVGYNLVAHSMPAKGAD
jgi:hypothetical protein